VATAQRILLYVHGIIGDTRFMIASARTGWLMLPTTPPALAERYDLLLTFDYESVNTTIQENARKLKERLRAVGLGPPKELPREVRHFWRKVRSVWARMRSVLEEVPAVGEPC
jgi:hypothetical protein